MDPFYYLCSCFFCHTIMSVPCSYMVTCWEWIDPFFLLHVMLSFDFDTFTPGSDEAFDLNDA